MKIKTEQNFLSVPDEKERKYRVSEGINTMKILTYMNTVDKGRPIITPWLVLINNMDYVTLQKSTEWRETPAKARGHRHTLPNPSIWGRLSPLFGTDLPPSSPPPCQDTPVKVLQPASSCSPCRLSHPTGIMIRKSGFTPSPSPPSPASQLWFAGWRMAGFALVLIYSVVDWRLGGLIIIPFVNKG